MVEATRPGHPIEVVRAHPVAVSWILLALGAALLRLIVLDRQPLSEAEARYALPAWQAVMGQFDGSLVESGAPLLSHAMVVVFGLFGASDVAARLVPALAGVGLSLTPGLLTGTFGLRTTLWAAVLIAVSPVAVHASRVVDPAVLTAGLVMLTVGSAIRLASDRPWWSPWTLALGAGLSLAAEGGAVLAMAAASAAVLVIFARATDGAGSTGWRTWLPGPLWNGRVTARAVAAPAMLFVGAALLAATGGLVDLRGVGFVFADVWSRGLGLLTPDAFPSRNLASLLAYGWPLLALALGGYLLAVREARPPRPAERRRVRHLAQDDGDPIELEGLGGVQRLRLRATLSVALWTLILLVVGAVAGADQLSLVVLPIAPLAVLAGTALGRLPIHPLDYELSGEGWTTLTVTAVLGMAAIVIFSQNVAGSRPIALVAWVALIGLLVLLATGWRSLGVQERIAVLTILGGVVFLAATASGLSRASFGGSPPGTELLAREETAPAFRALFRELNVLASADPSRVLVVDLPETFAARWYGRAILPGSGEQRASPRAFVLREAPRASGPGPTEVARVPWKTTSEIEPADVYPLGILRWLVSRSTLVHGQPHDIIVTR